MQVFDWSLSTQDINQKDHAIWKELVINDFAGSQHIACGVSHSSYQRAISSKDM